MLQNCKVVELMLVFVESGNMIIMALSYTRVTKDNSLISNNYALLTQWTQYLIDDSLVPADQYVFFDCSLKSE
jgi:hypothetical protein